MAQNLPEIHPTAIIEDGATIGVGAKIGPFCIIEKTATIGARTHLRANVHILGHTQIGEDCDIHSFAVLGGAPQDLSYRGEPTKVIIGDRCTFRENTTVSRGTLNGKSETIIGNDCYLMSCAHVGHDSIVGNNVVMASNVALAGHVTIGERVILGGLSAVHQHCRVGRHAFVGGLAAVVSDVIPYGSVIGVQAHLAGLNLVGLKRRGFSRVQIHEMRAAYRMLFAEEGTLQERIEDVIERFSEVPEVMEIIDFVRRDSARPLCSPRD